MKTIEQIVDELQQKFDVNFVGKIQSYRGGEDGKETDIDFFIKKSDVDKMTNYFIENNFIVILGKDNASVSARKYINGNIYYFDMKASLLPRIYLPGLEFTEKYYEDSWSDNRIEKFFRYIIKFRGNEQKCVDFVKHHWIQYGEYLFDTTYLNKPLCKKGAALEDVVGAMKKHPKKIISTYGFKRVYNFFIAYIKFHLARFWKEGEIIAFIGPDGSGKTTVIDAVKKSSLGEGPHVVYMGDKSFKLQKFYDWLHRRGVPLSYLVYFFAYIENWCRYMSIWFKKLKGDVVLADRWPNYNSFHANKKRRVLENVLYFMFPNPDRFVFLNADPEVIHKRKPERTIGEIKVYQQGIREKLKNTNHIIVATDTNFDDTINTVFRFMVYGGRTNVGLPDEVVKRELVKAISR